MRLLPTHHSNAGRNIVLWGMNRIRGYIIAMHCFCWLIFFSIPALFVAGQSGSSNIISLIFNPAWLYFLVYIFIFYIHTYFLLPGLYFKKKYLPYLLGMLILAVSVYWLRPYDKVAMINKHWINRQTGNNLQPPPGSFLKPQVNQIRLPPNTVNLPQATTFPQFKGKRPRFDIISTVLFILIIAMSITLVMIKRWQEAAEHAARAEADKTNAELAILKAQINPHFLFNTLNNIYSQALTHDERTAPSIMKLSNIMRYITDDANQDFVSLSSESNFISDYIELQRLRLGSKITLDFAINGKLDNKVIAPLILITFIENVFKYGISNNEPSTITIELRAYNDSIAFYSRNKLYPLKNKFESTGIGIANTRKRLEHLYPGKHSLTIKEAEGYYAVHLVLQS